MKFRAEIDVMPLKELLDPQGKAVKLGLKILSIHTINDVRIGKHISIEIEAETQEIAKKQINIACQKLLINPTIENYQMNFTEVKEES